MPKLSWIVKGYLIWGCTVALWFTTVAAFGWKMPAMNMGTGAGVRSGGGIYPHSSWSFGK